MRDFVKQTYADLVGRMEANTDLSDEDAATLKAAIEDWKKNGSF